MPVTTTKSSRVFGGNGVSAVFACDFRIFSTTDVTVSVVDPNTGATTVLVNNTDYAITGANNDPGFTLTTTVPVATGKNLLVDRQVAYTQPTSFTNQSRFFPILHQDMADRLAMQIQQLVTLNGNTLKKPNEAVNFYDLSGNRLSNVGSGTASTDGVNIAQLSSTLATSNAYTDNAVAGVVGGFGFFQQSGTGAQGRTFQDRMRDSVSVFDFIPASLKPAIVAKTSTVDLSSYIQAACNSGASKVEFPNGKYTLASTVIPAANQCLEGQSDGWGGQTTIAAATGLNAAVIKFTSTGSIRRMSVIGSASGATSSQNLIYINNCNGVLVEDLFLSSGYNGILIDGTSFFITLRNMRFYNQINVQLNVNSGTSAGVDLIMDNARFLSHNGPFCMVFSGLGSMLSTNVQCSVNTATVATVLWDFSAPQYGGMQATNWVLENTGSGITCYIKGTAGNPWNYMRFVNCNIGADTGNAIRMDYAKTPRFTDCSIASSTTGGIVLFPASCNVHGFHFSGCDFQGNGTVAPIVCGSPVSISGEVLCPSWTGSASLVDFSAAALGNVTSFNLIGGEPGTNGIPARLTSEATVPGTRLSESAWIAYTPTVASVAGTLTSAAASGSYMKIGKTIHYRISAAIVTNGTGSSAINLGLPRNAGATAVGVGKASQISGKALIGSLSVGLSVIRVSNYDGSYPAVDGEILVMTGTYQTD